MYSAWQSQQVLTTISTTGLIFKKKHKQKNSDGKVNIKIDENVYYMTQKISDFFAAYPVTKIEFPSVTICSPGSNELITNATLIKMFYDFLHKKFDIKTELSPLNIAQLLNKVRLSQYAINIFNYYFMSCFAI